MKITICSSAFFAKESYELKKKLEEEGHVVFIYPKEVEISGRSVPIEEFYEMRKKELTEGLLEVKARLIEEHIKRIERSDAILVLNLDKKGKEGYIGGNTFMEIAIAFYLNKKNLPLEGTFEGPALLRGDNGHETHHYRGRCEESLLGREFSP